MNKNAPPGLMLIAGGLIVGAITINGFSCAESAKRQTASIPVATSAADDPAKKIWIDSDACRLTRGTDAYAYCFAASPGHDQQKTRDSLRQVRQCALDAIAKFQGITQDQITEDDVIELLYGLATYYPDNTDKLDDLSLEMSMHTLINDYLMN